MKLHQALLGCAVGLLRTIAAERGLRVDASTLRSELVGALGGELARASAAGVLWRDLDDAERVVVSLVGAAQGRHDADLLLRRVAARLGESAGGMDPEGMLARLTERGILFRVFSWGGSASGASYVLPEEYLEVVAGWSPADARHRPKRARLSPTTILQSDPVLDCFVLASALRREGWNRAARAVLGGSGPTARQVFARLRPSTAALGDRRTAERWGCFL